MNARKRTPRATTGETVERANTTAAATTDAADTVTTTASRDTSRCQAPNCPRPEVVDGVGLCGAHYALRPDLRKEARHG